MHANKFIHQYPRAVRCIIDQHYVPSSKNLDMQLELMTEKELGLWWISFPISCLCKITVAGYMVGKDKLGSYTQLLKSNRIVQSTHFRGCKPNCVWFAAVAYLRFESGNSTECALVLAKTKVAPLRPMSIPRLQAATLGARLADNIRKNHNLQINSQHMSAQFRNIKQNPTRTH